MTGENTFSKDLLRFFRRATISGASKENTSLSELKKEVRRKEATHRVDNLVSGLIQSEFTQDPQKILLAEQVSSEICKNFPDVSGIILLGSSAHGGSEVRKTVAELLQEQQEIDSDFDYGVITKEPLSPDRLKLVAEKVKLFIEQTTQGLVPTCDQLNGNNAFYRNAVMTSESAALEFLKDDNFNPESVVLYFHPSFPAEINEENRSFLLSALEKLKDQDQQKWQAIVRGITKKWQEIHEIQGKHLRPSKDNEGPLWSKNRTWKLMKKIGKESSAAMVNPLRNVLENNGEELSFLKKPPEQEKGAGDNLNYSLPQPEQELQQQKQELRQQIVAQEDLVRSKSDAWVKAERALDVVKGNVSQALLKGENVSDEVIAQGTVLGEAVQKAEKEYEASKEKLNALKNPQKAAVEKTSASPVVVDAVVASTPEEREQTEVRGDQKDVGEAEAAVKSQSLVEKDTPVAEAPPKTEAEQFADFVDESRQIIYDYEGFEKKKETMAVLGNGKLEEITQLDNNIQTLSGAIRENQRNVSTLDQEISRLEDKITKIQANQDTTVANRARIIIGRKATYSSEAQSEIDKNKTEILKKKQEKAALEQKIDTQNLRLAGHKKDREKKTKEVAELRNPFSETKAALAETKQVLKTKLEQKGITPAVLETASGAIAQQIQEAQQKLTRETAWFDSAKANYNEGFADPVQIEVYKLALNGMQEASTAVNKLKSNQGKLQKIRDILTP